ncbi:MAG TPA: JAB domain-containing protein [Nitrospira sp.]|nr:JAB domain-containing protein [Nitrospira sp.]
MAKQSLNGLKVHNFIPRYKVCIVPDGGHTGPRGPMRDSAAAASALRPCFVGLDREQFVVCCLDAKHAIIGINVVSIGSLTLSIVHPREVFKPAILLNSCAIIAAHNHPSGDPTPSVEDRTLTKRLREAGDLLGIRLLDHLILGEDSLYSFGDEGWPV